MGGAIPPNSGAGFLVGLFSETQNQTLGATYVPAIERICWFGFRGDNRNNWNTGSFLFKSVFEIKSGVGITTYPVCHFFQIFQWLGI